MIGTCLCGAVKIHAAIDGDKLAVCHCSMCRKWGGGPNISLETEQLAEIEGEASITAYPSSEWASRSFCKHCGTSLFYKLNDAPFISINANLFDLTDQAEIVLEVYSDQKPHYYPYLADAKRMTQAEVEAMFAVE